MSASEAKDAAIAVQGISLVLGDGDQSVTALNNVSLAVRRGEFVAVAGPSGSGKSSLLAVCGGLRRATSGRIHVGDAEITALPERELTRLRAAKIGFVFQQSNLVPSLSAVDQLLLMVRLLGRRPTAADEARAQALLNGMGLGARASRRPGQLSGGENQRVGIARALMNGPDVLLVDEPTSMLDRHRGREIVELLARQTREHGVATLMVTHDVTMLPFADRVLHMEDGRILRESTGAAA